MLKRLKILYAGGSMTDAGLRIIFFLDEAFLRAGGPTNKKLIWCGLRSKYIHIVYVNKDLSECYM